MITWTKMGNWCCCCRRSKDGRQSSVSVIQNNQANDQNDQEDNNDDQVNGLLIFPDVLIFQSTVDKDGQDDSSIYHMFVCNNTEHANAFYAVHPFETSKHSRNSSSIDLQIEPYEPMYDHLIMTNGQNQHYKGNHLTLQQVEIQVKLLLTQHFIRVRHK